MTAEEMIAHNMPAVAKMFRVYGRSNPCVFIHATDGTVRVLDVLPIFMANSQKEAAFKKLQLIPTIRKHIRERDIDVAGYVFVCDGWSADPESEATKRERAAGRRVANMTDKVPVVLFAAEAYDPSGAIQRVLGEREIVGFEFHDDAEAYEAHIQEHDAKTLAKTPKGMPGQFRCLAPLNTFSGDILAGKIGFGALVNRAV